MRAVGKEDVEFAILPEFEGLLRFTLTLAIV